MGFSYRAVVTFPADACVYHPDIAAVAASVEDDDEGAQERLGTWGWEDESDGDGLIRLACDEASHGRMVAITDLLDKHRVPYDHYHDECEGTASEGWSELQVRYANGKRAEYWTNEAQSSRFLLAEDIKAALLVSAERALTEIESVLKQRPQGLEELDYLPSVT